MKNTAFLIYLFLMLCVGFIKINAQNNAFCGVVITLADQDNSKYNTQLTTTKKCYNYDAAGNLIGLKPCSTNSLKSFSASEETSQQEGPVDLGESIKAYPNPTRGIFYLVQEGNNLTPINKIQIISINSGSVIHVPTNAINKTTTIDLSGQALGVYVVNVIFTNGKNKSIKVIRY